MINNDLLIEIGVEEIPPKALAVLSDAFKVNVTEGLQRQQLQSGAITAYATPRRLALLIEGLDRQSPDQQTVVWGPPIKVAFDDNDQPTRAATAFSKKNSLPLDKLRGYVEDDGQQHKLCVRKTVPGTATETLLGEIINQALSGLPIPKRMRWAKSREEFVRPVRWAVVLYGDRALSYKILGITASNTSRGHRFHSPDEIVIQSPRGYQEQMHAHFVVASVDDRRATIRAGVEALAQEQGGTAVISEALLEEVAALCEWPVPLLGRFDEAFLDIPAEALISAMRGHQKYFHVIDDNGNLLPLFITVANIDSLDPGQVVAGNERVIRPRLADAAFFYHNDLKVSLQERRQGLKKVVYQAQLGSLFEKTERVAALSRWLATATGADPLCAERAGLLCKSDLISDMVGEFDDLQGIMGRYYAANDGEDPTVASALYEQYLPRFSGDKLPQEPEGIALALADRLDTLVGIFSIGQQPTGSKDPFALRRASLGLLRIIVQSNIDVDLKLAIYQAAKQLPTVDTKSLNNLCEQVHTYILERNVSAYKEQGIRIESYNAVAALDLSNPLDIDARVIAVHRFSQRPEAIALASANKRVANILAKQADQPVAINPAALRDDAEILLAKAIQQMQGKVAPLIAERKYHQALELLVELHEIIDRFFVEVMVLAEDPDIRTNRIALLQQLRCLFLDVADISLLATS